MKVGDLVKRQQGWQGWKRQQLGLVVNVDRAVVKVQWSGDYGTFSHPIIEVSVKEGDLVRHLMDGQTGIVVLAWGVMDVVEVLWDDGKTRGQKRELELISQCLVKYKNGNVYLINGKREIKERSYIIF